MTSSQTLARMREIECMYDGAFPADARAEYEGLARELRTASTQPYNKLAHNVEMTICAVRTEIAAIRFLRLNNANPVNRIVELRRRWPQYRAARHALVTA